MKTRARHTIVRYRRSNISTQFSRGHSLRTNLAPRLDVQRQSRSIINATLEGVDDYRSLGRAVFALLEFPSRRSLSPPPTPHSDQGSKHSAEQQSMFCQMKTKRYGFERYVQTVSRFSLLRINDRTKEEEISFHDLS